MKRAVLVGLFAVVVACASKPGGETSYEVPNREQFIGGGVSLFMERKCGALDCHGQPGRPLRIYSQLGLRLHELDGGGRDTSNTSRDERVENYRTVVGLEPEQMSQCMQSYGDCTLLLVYLKPLDIEGGGVRHKGGPVLRKAEGDQGDPGWICLQSWLRGNVDAARCSEAADLR